MFIYISVFLLFTFLLNLHNSPLWLFDLLKSNFTSFRLWDKKVTSWGPCNSEVYDYSGAERNQILSSYRMEAPALAADLKEVS